MCIYMLHVHMYTYILKCFFIQVHSLLSSLDHFSHDRGKQLEHFTIIPLLGLALSYRGHASLSIALPLMNYVSYIHSTVFSDQDFVLTPTSSLNAILEPLMHKRLKGVVSSSHAHLLLWLLDQLIDFTASPTELPPGT